MLAARPGEVKLLFLGPDYTMHYGTNDAEPVAAGVKNVPVRVCAGLEGMIGDFREEFTYPIAFS